MAVDMYANLAKAWNSISTRLFRIPFNFSQARAFRRILNHARLLSSLPQFIREGLKSSLCKLILESCSPCYRSVLNINPAAFHNHKIKHSEAKNELPWPWRS